jgi:hypothetical protein
MPETLLGEAGAAVAAPGAGDVPAAAAVPLRDQIFRDDGAFNEGWAERLPEDLRAEAPTLTRFPDFTELARSYTQLRKRLSEKVPAPPGKDAGPGEVAAWRKLAGIPENADGYEFRTPEKLPDGVTWPEGLLKDFAGIAHKLNIHPAAAQELAEWWTGRQGEAIEQAGQNHEARIIQEEQQLRQAWGDDFQANSRKAKIGAATLGLDITDPQVGLSSTVLKALAKVPDLISEDRLVRGEDIGLAKTGHEMGKDIMTNPQNPQYANFHGENGPQAQAEAEALVNRYYAQR